MNPLQRARSARQEEKEDVRGFKTQCAGACAGNTESKVHYRKVTHAETIHQAIRDVAASLPGFDELDSHTQQILLDLGEEYFRAEFVPRLEGMINLPRYEVAMYETTGEDRAYIEDQIEFLTVSIAKAHHAAHEQLLEKSAALLNRKKTK